MSSEELYIYIYMCVCVCMRTYVRALNYLMSSLLVLGGVHFT